MGKVIDRSGIVTDEWQVFNRSALPGAVRRVLVNSDDLLRYPRYFERASFELGLNLGADEAVQDVAGWLPLMSMVRLNFESFADGRAFSQARLLRQRFAFGGDIRAHGQVLRDQLLFMCRCGINQFSLAPGEDFDLALAAFGDIGESYQPDWAGGSIDGLAHS